MSAIARAIVPRNARHWIRRRFGKTPEWNIYADYRPANWPGEGMTLGAPDFVGVGSQRSGSTWWWTLIQHHPQVFHDDRMSKEVRYLVRFFEEEPTAADVTEYASWFPRPAGRIVGEWTPIYLSYPWIGSVLERVAPDAKILAILRDPVERFRSGVELQRERVVDPVTTLRQVGIGDYALQLRRSRPSSIRRGCSCSSTSGAAPSPRCSSPAPSSSWSSSPSPWITRGSGRPSGS